FAVCFEESAVAPRAVLESFEKRDPRELDEVLEAGCVLCQQSQMRVRVPLAGGFLIEPTGGGHVRLVADDRIEPRLLALVVKLDRAIEIAVIGNGARAHPELLGLFDQLRYAVGAIEQAVV